MPKIKLGKLSFWLEKVEDPGEESSILLMASNENKVEEAILEIDKGGIFRDFISTKEFGIELDSDGKVKDYSSEKEEEEETENIVKDIKKVKGRVQIIINCN